MLQEARYVTLSHASQSKKIRSLHAIALHQSAFKHRFPGHDDFVKVDSSFLALGACKQRIQSRCLVQAAFVVSDIQYLHRNEAEQECSAAVRATRQVHGGFGFRDWATTILRLLLAGARFSLIF